MDFEKCEILNDEGNWRYRTVILEPILNGIKYQGNRFTVDVKYKKESPQVIFEYNIKEKGHYVKINTLQWKLQKMN